MTILVVSPAEAPSLTGPHQVLVNVTSHNAVHGKLFSPFFLGPITLYNGLTSQNMENAWQFSKVYASLLETDGSVGEKYFAWARAGWQNSKAERYPMGKGARPLFSLWAGEQLPYVEARKRVYFPLYRNAVYKSGGYDFLNRLYQTGKQLILVDFDGYNHRSAMLNYTYADVLNDAKRRMGHAFILAMMLDHGPGITVEEVETACGYRKEPEQGALF